MQELKIENVNMTDINEYSNNAKLHPDWQIEQIANSIKKFGFNDPIAINENNTIIEGHGRYIACKRLGFKEVPCIRLKGMTDAEERAYIIAHNKLTMNTDFDMDALQLELNALQIEGIDLELTGFDQEEIDEIMNDIEEFDDDFGEYGDNGEIGDDGEEVLYFSKEEIKKDIVDTWRTFDLDEFVANIIDEPTAKSQFNRLCSGKQDGYMISLLFNPHRLTTSTLKSDDIFTGYNTSQKYREVFANYLVEYTPKILPRPQYYKHIGIGHAGFQYVNEFQPYLARDIYKHYCKDGYKVLNPCGGWGGRLLGIASCQFNDIEYIEVEPSSKTFEGLQKMGEWLGLGERNYKRINKCFEDTNFQENYFDFVFTSPPYYDTEHYAEEETQSFIKYKTYEEWRDGFLNVMIDKIVHCMKQGGKCLLNVGNKRYPLSDDIKEHLLKRYGIKTEDTEFALDAGSSDAIRTSNEDFLLFTKR